MFSALSVRNFRLYWLGMLISLVGTWIQTVAQSWLVFELTSSAFLLGLVGFLGSIPIFLFSLFGGVLADRVSKKHVLLLTQSAFMVLAFTLAVLTQLKVVTPWHIMCLAVLNGTVMAFDGPSRQSVVVELVGKKHLLNAIALNSAAFNSARIVGPALAGILIAAIGMSGCFYVNGISFFAVIVALLLIELPNGGRKPGTGGFLFGDLLEGLRFVGTNSVIRVLMMMVGMSSLFGISYVILMPMVASDVLGLGIQGLGTLMSAAGAGALLAALLLARSGSMPRKGSLLVASSLLFSVSLVSFALSRVYILSLLLLVCIGYASVTTVSLINTLLQTSVPDEVRGRVMSVFMLTFAGFLPFGNLIAGAIAHRWGVSASICTGGVACVIFFSIVNIIYPQIRRL